MSILLDFFFLVDFVGIIYFIFKVILKYFFFQIASLMKINVIFKKLLFKIFRNEKVLGRITSEIESNYTLLILSLLYFDQGKCTWNNAIFIFPVQISPMQIFQK
jgi:hypothetical protein